MSLESGSQAMDALSLLPMNVQRSLASFRSPAAGALVDLDDFRTRLQLEAGGGDARMAAAAAAVGREQRLTSRDVSLSLLNRTYKELYVNHAWDLDNIPQAVEKYATSLSWAVSAHSLILNSPASTFGSKLFASGGDSNWDSLFTALPPPQFPRVNNFKHVHSYVTDSNRCRNRALAWPLFLQQQATGELAGEMDLDMNSQQARLAVLQEFARTSMEKDGYPGQEDNVLQSAFSALVAMLLSEMSHALRVEKFHKIPKYMLFVVAKLLYPSMVGPMMVWCATLMRFNGMFMGENVAQLFAYSLQVSRERVMHPVGKNIMSDAGQSTDERMAWEIAMHTSTARSKLKKLFARKGVPLTLVPCKNVPNHFTVWPNSLECSMCSDIDGEHVVFLPLPDPVVVRYETSLPPRSMAAAGRHAAAVYAATIAAYRQIPRLALLPEASSFSPAAASAPARKIARKALEPPAAAAAASAASSDPPRKIPRLALLPSADPLPGALPLPLFAPSSFSSYRTDAVKQELAPPTADEDLDEEMPSLVPLYSSSSLRPLEAARSHVAAAEPTSALKALIYVDYRVKDPSIRNEFVVKVEKIPGGLTEFKKQAAISRDAKSSKLYPLGHWQTKRYGKVFKPLQQCYYKGKPIDWEEVPPDVFQGNDIPEYGGIIDGLIRHWPIWANTTDEPAGEDGYTCKPNQTIVWAGVMFE